jgi:hypothetical protein
MSDESWLANDHVPDPKPEVYYKSIGDYSLTITPSGDPPRVVRLAVAYKGHTVGEFVTRDGLARQGWIAGLRWAIGVLEGFADMANHPFRGVSQAPLASVGDVRAAAAAKDDPSTQVYYDSGLGVGEAPTAVAVSPDDQVSWRTPVPASNKVEDQVAILKDTIRRDERG